jgi:cytochrome c biogenesis protein CcmG, thiol:disulfide interchange protein DsbE
VSGVVQIGPLAMAVDRLLAIAAIWLFIALIGLWGKEDSKLAIAGWVALGFGVVAARIAFVATNFDAFSVEPASILYLWQGGFLPWYGVAAAAAALFLTLKGRALKLALGALALVTATWILASHFLADKEPRPFPQTVSVTNLAGTPVDLKAFHGRPFAVNLWATWCPPCQREMPMLVEVAKTRPEVPILFVNQGEDPARVARYLKENGLDAANMLLDRRNTFGAALGSSALPTTLFVGADGGVREIHPGEISRAALIAQIHDLKETRK